MTLCLPQVHICALRVTDLLPDGVPEPGTGKMIAVDSVVDLTMTPVVRAGAAITQPGGCGTNCIDYQAPDSVPWYDFAVTIWDHNPYVMAALGGGDILEDGDAVGSAAAPLGEVARNPRSVEFWTKRIDDGELASDGYPYAWGVIPLTTYGRQGPFVRNNGATMPTFVARAFENPNWFDGPLNDWPVASDRVWQWFPTPSLPTTDCEPQNVPVS